MTLILEIAKQFKQRTEVTSLAVEICDRFFMKQQDFNYTNESIVLYSMTMLLIASKYDELDEKIPMIKDISRSLCRILPS